MKYWYGNNKDKKMHNRSYNSFINMVNIIANSVFPHDKNKLKLSNQFFNGQVI